MILGRTDLRGTDVVLRSQVLAAGLLSLNSSGCRHRTESSTWDGVHSNREWPNDTNVWSAEYPSAAMTVGPTMQN